MSAALTSNNPKNLKRIYELVHEFVNRGPIHDELMDEVMQNWPRPTAPAKLWRVHALTKSQTRALPQGLLLPTYRFLSWTSDPETLDRLAASRLAFGTPVIIEATIPAEEICIDVQDFARKLAEIKRAEPNTYDFNFGDLQQYADEAEVIVAHKSPLKLTPQNTHIYTVPETDAPKVGDKIYRPHTLSDDTWEITAVHGKNRNGTWRVSWYEGEDNIRSVAKGEWETIAGSGSKSSEAVTNHLPPEVESQVNPAHFALLRMRRDGVAKLREHREETLPEVLSVPRKVEAGQDHGKGGIGGADTGHGGK